MKHVGRLLVLLFGAFIFPGMVSAATYYVDATLGNNSNNGTAASTSWQTLAKVNGTTFLAGDNILFKKGETFTGVLVAGQSGTNGNPITYGSYGEGARPIINAAGNNHGFDIRTGKSYINVAGLEVRNATLNQFLLFANSSNISHVSIQDSIAVGGTSGFNLQGPGTFLDITISSSTASGYAGGSAVGVRLGSGTTFDGITLDGVSAASGSGYQGFSTGSGTYSNISILNSSFTGHPSNGIAFLSATTTNVVIRDTVASLNGGSGIYFFGVKSGVEIDNVTANSNTQNGIGFEAGAMNHISIEDSEFNNNGLNGIALLGSGTGTSTIVSRSIASGNDNDGFNISGNWQNVVFEEAIASDNGVDGIGSNGDGFSFHNSSTGVIRNSQAHNNWKSAVTNVNTSSTTVYNNLFSHDTNGTNALITFLDSGSHAAYNNVLYSPAQVGYGLVANGTTTLIARNNIIQGFQYGVSKGTNAFLVEDYNDVYGASTASYIGLTGGVHSISVNPKFVDAEDDDFRLLQSSLAINAGTTTPYVTDYLGNPRVGIPDMGAYEYQGIPDITAPSIYIIAPVDPATISGTVIITASATDAIGVEEVEFFLDGVSLGDDASDPYSFSWNSSAVPDGVYSLLAVAHDAEGNYATSSPVSVTVSNVIQEASHRSGKSGQSVVRTISPLADSVLNEGEAKISSINRLILDNRALFMLAQEKGIVVPEFILNMLDLPSGSTISIFFNRPLALGATGPDVTALQQILKDKGFYVYQEITGYYGQATLQAVADYQKSLGLESLGYVGPATREALNAGI